MENLEFKNLVQSIVEDVIKETLTAMMDVQPIQVVGKEHPAKQEKKKCQKHIEP